MVVYRAYLKVWAAYKVAAAPRCARMRLRSKIYSLTIDPRPECGRPLPGHTTRWCIQVGDYRLVYSIDDVKKAVTIIGIGFRLGR